MAYDEELAERLRGALQGQPALSEKRMFGGLAFLVGGHLAVSASGQGGLLLRVDPVRTEELVAHSGVERFRMRGKAMEGWLHVAPDAVGTDRELRGWLDLALIYVRSLPAK